MLEDDVDDEDGHKKKIVLVTVMRPNEN
jgi:hypothetical protein